MLGVPAFQRVELDVVCVLILWILADLPGQWIRLSLENLQQREGEGGRTSILKRALQIGKNSTELIMLTVKANNPGLEKSGASLPLSSSPNLPFMAALSA